jgi:cell division protein FtsB
VQGNINLGLQFRNFLNKPFKVLLVCNILFVVSLFFNGAIWRVWGLRRDLATITQQIAKSKDQSRSLDMQIRQAKDQAFMERQAKDKLDMVGEHDLVFVFSD